MSYSSKPNVLAQANQIADQMAVTYAAEQAMGQEVEFTTGPSLIEKIRVSRIGRAVALGSAVIAPAGAGFVSLVEAPIASAENVPAATSRQECIDDALGHVNIRNARLVGQSKSRSQGGFVNFTDTGMPSNCGPQFGVVRDERIQFLVQVPKHHAKMVPFAGVSFKLNDYGIGSGGGLHTDTVNSPPNQNYNLYECTPGAGKTGAKVQVEEIAENAQTEQPIARPKIFSAQIKRIIPEAC